jgi:DNA-binding cell septation regulator SpoVG
MKTNKDAVKENTYEVAVTRAHEFDNGNIVFDMIVNGVKIFGMKALEGSKGSFISFPQRKGTDGNYYNNAWFKITEELQAEIEDQIRKELG